MRQTSEKQYDFIKIPLTNGLLPGDDKGSNRQPVVTVFFGVVAFTIG